MRSISLFIFIGAFYLFMSSLTVGFIDSRFKDCVEENLTSTEYTSCDATKAFQNLVGFTAWPVYWIVWGGYHSMELFEE